MFSAEVIALCNRYKVQWSLENPRHSRLFEVPILADLLQQPFVYVVDLDFCMYGEPYKKPTRIFTTMEEMLELAKRCCHRKHHTVLRGSEVVKIDGKSQTVPKTQAAGQYPLKLTRRWAQVIKHRCGGCGPNTNLLLLQFSNELAKSFKGDPISEQQSQAPLSGTPILKTSTKRLVSSRTSSFLDSTPTNKRKGCKRSCAKSKAGSYSKAAIIRRRLPRHRRLRALRVKDPTLENMTMQ